jgi:hypothetical protein
MAISVIFNIRKFLLSFILLPWFFMGTTSFVAASEISLNIEHQVLENKKLQTFFGAYDEQSNLIEEFDVLDISVLYGDRYGDVRRLEKFESSRFGTAYTFMIDISKSMSIQNFNLIKASIAAWAEKLEEGDSVSLVSFGEEVLFLQDYTFYKDDFLLALDKVQRSDMETRFYDGLIQTYQFAEKMTPEKIFGFNLMKSISKTSNGLFFDANRLGIDNAFESAKQSIDNVFMLTSYCDKCIYDGSIIDFKLNIFIKDQALSASSNLLLPQTSIQSSSFQAQPAPNKTLLGISEKYLYIVAAVLLLFMIIIIMVRVFRKNNQFARLPTNLDFQATMPEMESDWQPPVDNSWAVAQNAMKDSSMKLNCQLVFLRSSTKHSITIGSDFIIGRSSKCALILKEHKEVSGTHCKLSFKDNLLTIEDLNSTNGTFVNGARITKPYPLSNLDSLSLGKAEFRINFKS